jgi:hypothetical protein
MLPGLRFLFVAIALSLSTMIFGLGAAALLRSAHEEFTNLPTMRPQPETILAQRAEATRPTLALLRVDTPVTEQKSTDRPTVPDVPNTAPPPEQSSPITSTEPDRAAAEPDRRATTTAALPSEEKSESSDKPSEARSSEAPAQVETAARIEMPAPPPENQAAETQKAETQAAIIPEPRSSAAVEATTAASEPTSAPTDDNAKAASLKIATLGGPAVKIEPQTASKFAVAPPGKRTQARRPIKRRRIVRARVAPPAPPAPVGLFGTPPGG